MKSATLNLPSAIQGTPAKSGLVFHNFEIAARLDEIADILEIQNANAFRVRVYRNASRIVTELPEEAALLIARGTKLDGLRGI